MICLAAIVLLGLLSASPPDPTLEFPAPGQVVMKLEGKVVLTARALNWQGGFLRDRVTLKKKEEPAEAMFLGYPHGPKTADWVPAGEVRRTWTLTFNGIALHASVPVASDRRPCVTNPEAPLASSYGPAVASFDDAVYDRSQDWLVAANGRLHLNAGNYEFDAYPFLTLKTDYYRDHLGYFLWDRSRPLWKDPVAGWCSWAAYGQDITQKEVEGAAGFFSKNLKDYGYKVVQIDDGYQRVLQLTDNHQPITEPFSDYWTKPNEKFPDGMETLAHKISDLGMTPGIWIGLYLPLGLKHSEGYVTGPEGKPLQGPWVGYSMRADDPAAVKEAYTDTLTTFRDQGWKYFKIDTLRHILYDSYRRVPELWAQKGTDSSHAYRALFEAVRAAAGPKNYLLACWGALPELAGLPDGCRIGEDVGPSFESMRKSAKYIAQFHYANNTIWRNDPDYMCLRVPLDQCRTWATMTSLAGEHVMVSDPVETYDADRVDILRRVGPPVVSHPMNVGPMKPDPEWMILHCAKDGQDWTVAARVAWSPLGEISKRLVDLGLDPTHDYLAYDFWSSKFLCLVGPDCPLKEAQFSALAQGACQVISFRQWHAAVPQVIGDDRHLSQGAVELEGVNWDGHTFSGQFLATPGRTWNLYVFVPDPYHVVLEPNIEEIEHSVYKISFPNGKGWTRWSLRCTGRS